MRDQIELNCIVSVDIDHRRASECAVPIYRVFNRTKCRNQNKKIYQFYCSRFFFRIEMTIKIREEGKNIIFLEYESADRLQRRWLRCPQVTGHVSKSMRARVFFVDFVQLFSLVVFFLSFHSTNVSAAAVATFEESVSNGMVRHSTDSMDVTNEAKN